MKIRLVLVRLVIVILMILGFSNFGTAQEFPTRAIQIVDPFGAGGSTTMNARIIAQPFSEILNVPVVIINKAGAGGSLGANFVAKAKPDGYTLLVFNSASNGVTVTLRSGVGYTNADFDLIGQYSAGQVALIVKSDAPWKTVHELIDYAKKNPGKLKFPASTSATDRFSMELFLMEAGGLKMDRIPVESGVEFSQMLLGGHAQVGCSPAADLYPHVLGGKARFLAFFNEERNPDFPDVPTFKESGLPGAVIQTWYGLATPKGTPTNVLQKLRETLATTMKDKSVHVMLKNMGNTAVYRDAGEFAKFAKHMEGLYLKIAQAANIKLQ